MSAGNEKAATVECWVGGKRQRATATRSGDVTNPATGAVTRKVPFCNAADIDAAVSAAAAAFPGWRDTPPLRRARVMQKFLQLLQANQKQIAQLVELNEGQLYTYDRATLIKMLDEALAGSRPRTQ